MHVNDQTLCKHERVFQYREVGVGWWEAAGTAGGDTAHSRVWQVHLDPIVLHCRVCTGPADEI